jgi:serine protease AprX
MSLRTERGANAETRSSALWGTGSRGGDSRSSALWGKGGRNIVSVCIAVCALGAPLAATASPGKGKRPVAPVVVAPALDSVPGADAAQGAKNKTFVDKDLLAKAKDHPGDKIRVIVQSNFGGSDRAGKALKAINKANGNGDGSGQSLDLVAGVVAELPAKLVSKLADVPGLTITPDAKVKLSGMATSLQLWPYESANASLWMRDADQYAGKLPAIAVVDSGIEAGRSDFGSRIVANVNLTTLPGNSAGDGRGHGTFVAGIAAGNGTFLAGAAPTAPIVSLDVMDDTGSALTSDVINACSWILENKGKYNIKVANFSLHSMRPSNFTRDPLDQAVEKLWFGGVTVVAAAGNYGTADGPSGVKYAPGNDPFVITVGAIDLNGTTRVSDDLTAPWSAWGYTYDGFAKPEVSAAGRYMVGPVPAISTIAKERPDKLLSSNVIQLSGTSFAAPVVSGTAAQILARHPNWGPDQVKGALMVTARTVSRSPRAAGAGQITASKAAALTSAPNPNAGIDKYVVADTASGGRAFNAIAWADAAQSDMSWSTIAWADIAWADSNVAAMSWSTIAWADIAWADLSQADIAWADIAWADSSIEDVAENDTLSSSPDGYTVTEEEANLLASDPDALLAEDAPAPVEPAAVTVSSTTPVVAPGL